MNKTICLALTGASGMPYGLRLLECLLAAGCHVQLLYSQAAQIVARQEMDFELPSRPAEARTALEQVAYAYNRVEASSDAPSGLLRVTAPMTLGVSLVGPLVTEFMQRYPQVQVELILSNEVVDPAKLMRLACAVRDFKARHASTLLTFDAVTDAIAQIEAKAKAEAEAEAAPLTVDAMLAEPVALAPVEAVVEVAVEAPVVWEPVAAPALQADPGEWPVAETVQPDPSEAGAPESDAGEPQTKRKGWWSLGR